MLPVLHHLQSMQSEDYEDEDKARCLGMTVEEYKQRRAFLLKQYRELKREEDATAN